MLGELGEPTVVVDGAVVAMTFAAAVARLREDENKEVAALVLRDRPLQAVIACWPMVRRELPAVEIAEGLSLDELWALVEFDEREVVELSGVSSGLALAAFRRAKGNRLVYPDGSVHALAKIVLQKMIKDACTGGGRGK